MVLNPVCSRWLLPDGVPSHGFWARRGTEPSRLEGVGPLGVGHQFTEAILCFPRLFSVTQVAVRFVPNLNWKKKKSSFLGYRLTLTNDICSFPALWSPARGLHHGPRQAVCAGLLLGTGDGARVGGDESSRTESCCAKGFCILRNRKHIPPPQREEKDENNKVKGKKIKLCRAKGKKKASR